jgi:hypothetical protein
MTGAVTSPALTTKSLGVSLAFNSPATSGGIAMWASAQAISQVRQPTHFSVSANMKEFNLSSCNVPASRTEVPPVSLSHKLKNGRQPKDHYREDPEPVIQIAAISVSITSSDYGLCGKPVPCPRPFPPLINTVQSLSAQDEDKNPFADTTPFSCPLSGQLG